MKVQGSTSLAVPKSAVWGTLTDPEQLTALLPQGEILAEDDAMWRARLSAPTALGDSTFTFTFTLLERRPEEHVRITGHGRASQNVVDLTADLDLSETDGGTEVRWEADIRFGGVLASLGQRSLRYVVQKQVEDVFRKMEAQHSGVPA